MRGRSAVWLGVVTALAVVGAGVAVWQRQAAVEPAQTGARLFPDLQGQISQAQIIEITAAAGRLRLKRNAGGVWVLPDKSDYPARPETVRETLAGLAEMTIEEAKTDDPALYGKIGVTDPGAAEGTSTGLRVSGASGAVLADLIIGKYAGVEAAGQQPRMFVRKAGEARSWLAAANLNVSAKVSAWIDGDFARIPGARINRVEVLHAGGEKLVITRASQGASDFALENIPAGRKIAAPLELNATAGALEFLEVEDVSPRATIDFERATLSQFQTSDGLQILARSIEADGKVWLALEAQSAGIVPAAEAQAKEAAAINGRVGPWAFRLNAPSAQALRPRMADLLEAEEPPVEKR